MEAAHVLFCDGILVSGMDAALPFPERPGLERAHRAALAALHLWNYLDRAVVLLQSRWHTHDEEPRAFRAGQGLSGADVAGDGMVPLVCIGDRGDGDPLLLPPAFRGRAQRRQSPAGIAMVWLVGAGVERRL